MGSNAAPGRDGTSSTADGVLSRCASANATTDQWGALSPAQRLSIANAVAVAFGLSYPSQNRQGTSFPPSPILRPIVRRHPLPTVYAPQVENRAMNAPKRAWLASPFWRKFASHEATKMRERLFFQGKMRAGLSPYNGLANRRLKPLGHLSRDGDRTRRIGNWPVV